MRRIKFIWTLLLSQNLAIKVHLYVLKSLGGEPKKTTLTSDLLDSVTRTHLAGDLLPGMQRACNSRHNLFLPNQAALPHNEGDVHQVVPSSLVGGAPHCGLFHLHHGLDHLLNIQGTKEGTIYLKMCPLHTTWILV